MANRNIGIVGGGIVGRLIGYHCVKAGDKVTLFDDGDFVGSETCSWVAAGMIAPYCELEYAEPIVSKVGMDSISQWPGILEELPEEVFYQQTGSLVVAHTQDRGDLDRLQRLVSANAPEGVMEVATGERLKEIEPEINPLLGRGLFFPEEAQIDSRGILSALGKFLEAKGAKLNFGTEVTDIGPGSIAIGEEKHSFDMVFDCRGLKGKSEIEGLRGIRGEVVRVQAPDVTLSRPVRLMHPRYPIYIVPRPDNNFVIGATSIENEDMSEISLRGALELLTALYTLHSGFSEARILETGVQCRPALLDNVPKIFMEDKLIRVNGLHRHGFLCSPKMAELAFLGMDKGKVEGYEEIYGEMA